MWFLFQKQCLQTTVMVFLVVFNWTINVLVYGYISKTVIRYKEHGNLRLLPPKLFSLQRLIVSVHWPITINQLHEIISVITRVIRILIVLHNKLAINSLTWSIFSIKFLSVLAIFRHKCNLAITFILFF